MMVRGLGSYGYLGVETTSLTPELREHFGVPSELGVMIGRVEEGSPAEAAGLKVGDVVTRVGDGDVTSGGRLRRLVRGYEKDEEAVVEYWRGGKVATTTVASRSLGRAAPRSRARKARSRAGTISNRSCQKASAGVRSTRLPKQPQPASSDTSPRAARQ